MRNYHILLVCFPALGHINPSLQLAHRLINLGVHVTFATTVFGSRLINKTQWASTTPTLSFLSFSDAFDDQTLKSNADFTHFFSQLKCCGSQFLTHLITNSNLPNQQGPPPFTFVIYSILVNWAADVATAFDIPSALFFVQPATLFSLYYYYFLHDYGDTISNKIKDDPSFSIQLPGLPLLSGRDMPSFFSPSDTHAFLLAPLREQFEFLDRQSHPKVLINTFDALEVEALRAMEYKFKMLAIGPLVPSDLLGDGAPQVSSLEDNYMGWLNSKAKSSVVYISFGSICVLSSQQEEEIMHALLESGVTFLWVMRSKGTNDEEKAVETNKEELKKLEEQGKIVSWCNQLQVMTHPSLGCFMTHCGWNSTIETLASGLPVVAFPQQIDQATNAKLVEDVWKTGVRVKVNTQGIVKREEIRRCLDLVMDNEERQKKEIEGNANKLKELARQAIGEGGSSYLNLKTFIREIDEGSSC